MCISPLYTIAPLPAKTAAAVLRELAEAYYIEADSDGKPDYPYQWLNSHDVRGNGYQVMYNRLTGRNPYPGEAGAADTPWCDICVFTYEEYSLFWLFLAAAIEAGDL